MNLDLKSTKDTTLSPNIFSTLFQNMFDPVVIYDYENETIKDCNQSMLQLLGYNQDELSQLTRFDLMPRFSSLHPQMDIHEIIKKDHRKKVLLGETIYSMGELKTKSGDAVFAQFNIVPTGEEKGDAFVILHDMTQQLESTKVLKKNKSKYKTIFNNACESIIYFDLPTQKLVECNDVVIKMFGVPDKETFLNTTWDNFYQEKGDGNLNLVPFEVFFEKIIQEAMQAGTSCQEFLGKKLTGEKFVGEVTTVSISETSGPRVIFFIKDITEKYYAQREWEKLYYEQEQILNSMPLQFGQKDLENNIVKCNETMRKVFDDKIENIEGKNLSEFMSEAEAKKSHAEDLEIARTKEPILGITFSVKTKEGKTNWSKIDKLPLLDKQGEVVGILTHVVDVTDLVESHKKIIESERNNNAMFDNAFDGIMIFDCNTNKILRCNLRLANYLSTNTQTIIATSLENFSPEYQTNGMKSQQSFSQLVKKTKKRGTNETEWRFLEKNGDVLTCELISYLLPQENTCQIMFVFKDITERKEQDNIIKTNVEELNKKNVELKKYIESNVQLENFAAIASHDMQAPLRTIHSYTQLLQKSLKEDATINQKEYMHFITSATANMRHLIQDLRAFSKVDSTKLNVRTIKVDFMLEEILKELKASIDYQKAIITLPDNLPEVEGDRIKLKQLFQNLITNALKYIGPDVQPNVEISFEELEDEWKFKVQDNGIGIADKDQKRIFQLFQRLHAANQYSGTGIGLSLCKKVVEQHFGEIGVESEPGKGSCFYFTITKKLSVKLKEMM